jgi:hypothetical protein
MDFVATTRKAQNFGPKLASLFQKFCVGFPAPVISFPLVAKEEEFVYITQNKG